MSIGQRMKKVLRAFDAGGTFTSSDAGSAVADAAAATAAAVTGTTPAGGTGATAGAYDTAAHRDALIATVAEIKTTVNAQITDVADIRTELNTLLARLRTLGIISS